MASKGLWKGKGVAGERELPTDLANSPNQLSKGPRKRKGKGVAPGALSKSLKKASSKRESNIEAQNSVAATENKCSKEALDKMFGNGEGRGHNHQECIKKRRMYRGPRADSPPPSPILVDVLFPMYPPEYKARLMEEVRLGDKKTLSEIDLENKRLYAKIEALKGSESNATLG